MPTQSHPVSQFIEIASLTVAVVSLLESEGGRREAREGVNLSGRARDSAARGIDYLKQLSGARVFRDTSPPVIDRGPLGEPLFPHPFKGSLAHTDYAGRRGVASLVSLNDEFAGVGVDIEFLTRKIGEKVIRRITSPREWSQFMIWAADETLPAHWRSGLALFCAKEAAIKTLSPLKKRVLTLRSTELTYDPANDSFNAGCLSGRVLFYQGALVACSWLTSDSPQKD